MLLNRVVCLRIYIYIYIMRIGINAGKEEYVMRLKSPNRTSAEVMITWLQRNLEE